MIVETYANTLYDNPGNTCHRYWIRQGIPILIGGSLLGPEDWVHLRKSYGISDVINVETEHDDEGKLPAYSLCQLRVPDDGTPFPEKVVLGACLYAASCLHQDTESSFYVHCQMGGSRSPSFAYALLRGVLGMGATDAIFAIRASCPERENFGSHPYHVSYLSSIEAALAPVLGNR